MTRQESRVSVAGEPLGPDRNHQVRRLVWDPLVPFLEGRDTIFVSPDGVLGTLPFEVLQNDDGRYLVEDHAFVYTGDVASLGVCATDRWQAHERSDLVAERRGLAPKPSAS